MDPVSLASFAFLHWGYLVGPGLTVLSTLHSRLSKWPVLQVLVKHMGGLPMVRWVLVDISRVILASWGSSVPSLQVQEKDVLGTLGKHLTTEELGVLSEALGGAAQPPLATPNSLQPDLHEVHEQVLVQHAALFEKMAKAPEGPVQWDSKKGWVSGNST